MLGRFSLAAIARAIWSNTFIALASRTVNVTHIAATELNSPIGNRVDSNSVNTRWNAGAVVNPNVVGIPLVDTHYHRGTAENVLISGRRDVIASAVATDAITAAAIATDAIGSAEFSQAAADKVWSSTTRTLTSGVNIVKSIQTVSITVTAGGAGTASISAVVIANSIIIMRGATGGVLSFNSTTQVGVTGGGADGNVYPIHVVEFHTVG